MRDKCIEHIENEFDLSPMSIFIIDIKIINRDLNKGYFWGKNAKNSPRTEFKMTERLVKLMK